MSAALLPLLIAVPFFAAGLLIVIGNRPRIQTAGLFGVLFVSMLSGFVLISEFQQGGAIAHRVGLWESGIAIPVAADMFTALMVTATGLLTLVCSGFAYVAGTASNRFFAPFVLFLIAGVNGVLLTADLFNLFVFIEVMLLPSYGLFVLATGGKTPLRQIAGARLYVVVNLLASTIFLAGVGFVYGVAGTVNIGQLAGAAQDDPLIALAMGVCLFALGIKAAVVPVHGWIGRTYPTATPAVTALFSGLHTKVAIYAIYRIYAVVFDGDSRYLWVGVALFSLTMVVGVLAAVGENVARPILTFHMVSQNGYILIGVALFTEAGIAAGVFYLVHHMIVKAALFLSTGAVEVHYGTGALGRLPDLAKREPLLATAFFVSALSMSGLPPFSGFVAKLTLMMASLDAGEVIAAIIMIAVSLVTLLSMLKIWSGMFWGKAEPDVATRSQPEVSVLMRTRLVVPSVLLALITLSLGLGAEGLLSLTTVVAEGLIDPGSYIEAVIGS